MNRRRSQPTVTPLEGRLAPGTISITPDPEPIADLVLDPAPPGIPGTQDGVVYIVEWKVKGATLAGDGQVTATPITE